MATILVVEDDKNTRLLLAARLKNDYNVYCAVDGVEALEIIHAKPVDMVVTDIMMPRMDGYELLETIRDEGNTMPVLLLTAKQTVEDKRRGFQSGTDDYLTKPINYEELSWRIAALLRRANIAIERKIVIGDTVLNSTDYSLTVKDKPIELSKKEFDLLFKLLSYPNRIFTKNNLLDDIWGADSFSGEDTIKTHISKLRAKLETCKDFQIVTIKGLGYKAEVQGVKG